MHKWNIDFYQKANGEVPVIEFLNNLDKKMRAKADREIELLRDYGNQLREPHSKSIKNTKGLFELRVKQSTNICRIFYFFVVGRLIILTNGFIKKDDKTPPGEIDIAIKYKSDYEERNLK